MCKKRSIILASFLFMLLLNYNNYKLEPKKYLYIIVYFPEKLDILVYLTKDKIIKINF
jgi:hypothetical protein